MLRDGRERRAVTIGASSSRRDLSQPSHGETRLRRATGIKRETLADNSVSVYHYWFNCILLSAHLARITGRKSFWHLRYLCQFTCPKAKNLFVASPLHSRASGRCAVNDRPSRLFSAQQEAPAFPRVGTGSSVSPWLNFGCRDAVFGRSMKCHPVEGGRPSPTPSFSLRSGSTARTVGCSPVPCPQPPRRARSTTSAISGD